MADKLVSADYLKKRFAYYAAHNLLLEGYCYFQAMKEVDGAPAVDAVPVVRCEDCKHYRAHRNCKGMGWCKVLDRIIVNNGYCSHGERREEVQEDG